MASFYLWLKEDGEGCDYMVGCGEKLIPLKATDRPTALEEVREKIDYYGFTARGEKILLLSPVEDLQPILEEMRTEKKKKDKQELLRRKKERLAALQKEIDDLK